MKYVVGYFSNALFFAPDGDGVDEEALQAFEDSVFAAVEKVFPGQGDYASGGSGQYVHGGSDCSHTEWECDDAQAVKVAAVLKDMGLMVRIHEA